MDLRDKPWNKNLQTLLAITIGLNLFPHIRVVPLWVTLVGFAGVTWKILYLTRGVRLPPKNILSIAAVVGTAAVMLSIPWPFNQRTASAMLVIIATSKLLESTRYRDGMLVIFASYFLLLIHLINSPTLASTIFMLIDLVWTTLLMYQLHWRDEKISAKRLLPSWRLIGLAIPLWIFLFFAFPRISVGSWNFQDPVASTGFSDNLDPGTIGKLIDSSETAFRVRFAKGETLPPGMLYWRGATLAISNGLKWTRGKDSAPSLNETVRGGFYDQRVIGYETWMEPGFQKWIFTLEFTTSLSPADRDYQGLIQRLPGFVYNSSIPIFSREVYNGQATWVAPIIAMDKEDLEPYLQLPTGMDSRIHDLVKELKTKGDLKYKGLVPEARYARQTLDWLVDQNFRYTRTLDPLSAQMGPEQLAEFLFNKRRGFCEHFAASFATLMRMMGVPSRVVVGFQGGVRNDVADYWIVRKMDAHAWSEIWVNDPLRPGFGKWDRIDPTERIAPLRLQLGGDYYKVDARELNDGLSGDEIRNLMNKGFSGFMKKTQYAWDLMQMQWNMFLLKYDLDLQGRLLKKIGWNGSATRFLGTVAALGFLVFMTVLSWTLWSRSHREDKVLVAWRRFCLQLEKAGVVRRVNEGPLQFAKRAASQKPEKSQEIHDIASQFVQVRYGKAGGTMTVKQFRSSVRRFSL
jgi:transglutaminase-like putative cysteine protease